MAVLAALVLGIPLAVLRAWVVQRLWVWFVAPTFGVETPKVAVLYGLAWVVGLLWPTPSTAADPVDYERVVRYVSTSLFMSTVGLVVGWVAHAFV